METPPQVTEKKSVLEEIAEVQRRAKMYLDALQLLEDKYVALERAKREVTEARKFFEEFRKNYYDPMCAVEKKKQIQRRRCYF